MYVAVPPPPQPPPPRGARRMTARPADPQSLGQPREGGPPPPQPPKLSHTPRGHTWAGGGPHAWCTRRSLAPYCLNDAPPITNAKQAKKGG